MSGQPVPIAVIDSGVHPGHPHLQGVSVEGWEVASEGAGFHLRPDDRDVHGHGTAVAAAIVREGLAARLIAVRVLDRRLRCETEALAHAIEAAAERGARLINLSLSTSAARSEAILGRAVERAATRGAWVVAAAAARGPGWPADLENVLSAEAERGCPPGRCTRRLRRWRFGAHGEARPPGDRPSGERPTPGNLAGNSLAAAHLTALAAAALDQGEVTSVAQLARRLDERYGTGETKGGHG